MSSPAIDNLSTRTRLLILVLGSLGFITAVMGPLAVSVSKGKDAEFKRRLEAASAYDDHVLALQTRETERASSKLGFIATTMLALTVFSGLYAARGIARRVTHLTAAAERMRDGDLDTPVRTQGNTELDGLARSLDRMRGDLRRVLALSVKTTELEKDLAIASTMQSMFLPKQTRFERGALRLAAHYRPAARCGGDFWWHGTLADGRTLIVVGDVTGHGTGPAMITASATTALHTLCAEGLAEEPPRLLHELNDVLREACDGLFYTTLSAALIDDRRGHVTLWNAGAPPVLVLQPDGSLEVLVAAGSRLGEHELTLGECELDLAAGARLLMFTDGVPELVLDGGLTLGLRRLRKALGEGQALALDAAFDRLVSLLRVSDAGRIEDDMTLLLIEVAPESHA